MEILKWYSQLGKQIGKFKTLDILLEMVAHTFTPSKREWGRQVDFFKASLVYILSFSTTRVTEKPFLGRKKTKKPKNQNSCYITTLNKYSQKKKKKKNCSVTALYRKQNVEADQRFINDLR